MLLRAMPRIRRAVPGAALDLLGDGPERERYEALAAGLGVNDACRFAGAVPFDEVLRRMAAAAVQVSPSLREAFGLVNLEAHSVGTPVVASDVDGIREVVVDGETGVLVPPGDADALADAIVEMLQDEGRRHELGRAARARFEAEFSMDGISAHAEYFEDLLRG